MDVSIIVPFVTSGPTLDACLGGIRTQRYDEGRIEVILVRYGAGSVVGESMAPEPPVRLLAVDHPSPYAARNLAASHACGDALLFTEPVCVPEPGWIGAHVRRLRRAPVTISVGHVAPARTTPAVEMFFAYEDERDAWVFASRRWRHYFGRPKNMAIARRRFESHGPFEEVIRGADSSFVQRIARDISCDEIALAPEAVVRHQGIRGLPSCLHDRFTHSHAMQRHRSSHAAPINLPDRVRLFGDTVRRQDYGPVQAATLLVLLGAGILAFRLGAWTAVVPRTNRP